jgi:hypothetical protein
MLLVVALPTDNSRGVIYDSNVFIEQATGYQDGVSFFRLEIDTNCSSRKKTFLGELLFVHVDNPVKLFTAVIYDFL